MEILLAIAVVVIVGALIYFNRSSKSLDVNNDGKIDLSDASLAARNTVEGVKNMIDANNDGRIDSNDVKVVAKTTMKKAKVVASKTKAVAAKAKAGAKTPTKRAPKKTT